MRAMQAFKSVVASQDRRQCVGAVGEGGMVDVCACQDASAFDDFEKSSPLTPAPKPSSSPGETCVALADCCGREI